jgi:hypothetical protein
MRTKLLVGKLERKKPLERPRCRWEAELRKLKGEVA